LCRYKFNCILFSIFFLCFKLIQTPRRFCCVMQGKNKFYNYFSQVGSNSVENNIDSCNSCWLPTWRTILGVFISLFYMFRATHCSSSGESIVSIHQLAYITMLDDCLVCRSGGNFPPDRQYGQSSTRMIYSYTRWCIDTTDSPDDEHWVARNM
jgi:hypothetical protein